jgi:hypothetical protein
LHLQALVLPAQLQAVVNPVVVDRHPLGQRHQRKAVQVPGRAQRRAELRLLTASAAPQV